MIRYLIKYLPSERSKRPSYFPMTAASPADAVQTFRALYLTPPEIMDVYNPPLPASFWEAGVIEE